jgi:transposase
MASLWGRLLGLSMGTVVERVDFDSEAEVVVAHVRPRKSSRRRCGRCGLHARGYDRGEGRRRWRALDLGSVRVWLEGEAPRVRCRGCGVTVAEVPWARHGAGHTRHFDDTVAWLATRSSKTAVTELMRVSWRTVGAIITRVMADISASVDRLDGLRRVGIDEIAYKKYHHYLVVVVDLDSGRLVWAAPGKTQETMRSFFDDLGPERSALLTHVCSDEASWIVNVVTERCPQAVLAADPFHVVAWATNALDRLRRQTWNETAGRLRGGRGEGRAKRLKSSRYALWKNPEDLTPRQAAQLAWVASIDPRLFRGYRLKEGLRAVFAVKGEAGKELLDRWLRWAQRSKIEQFVEVGRMIRRHRRAINAALEHGLSNSLTESTNTKIRLLTRIAFGFHNPEPLIALALLALGGHQPPLPGRSNNPRI